MLPCMEVFCRSLITRLLVSLESAMQKLLEEESVLKFLCAIVCWHPVCARMLQAEESHSKASTGPVVALPPCTFAAMFDTYASP